MKILIGLAGFWFVAICLAVYHHRKENGEWMKPMEYIMQLFRHAGILIQALGGQWLPQLPKGIKGDSKWGRISVPDHATAMIQTAVEMKRLGIDGDESYKEKTFDCENHAQLVKALYDVFMRENIEEGLGIPTRVRAYRKDNGVYHAVFIADIEDEERWFEPYAHINFREIFPSTAEKRNVWAVIKG